MNRFYISDLHLGHANAIRFDRRPFANVEEMDNTIIQNWNNRVTNSDTVFVLGDMIWLKGQMWEDYLNRLNGHIVLVRGNHDAKKLNADVARRFTDICEYKEIRDEDRGVIMSHYPIPFHKRSYDPNVFMLYGHVHATKEYAYIEKLRYDIIHNYVGGGDPRGNFINVGCMMPYMNYTPRTLDEIIEGDKQMKAQ